MKKIGIVIKETSEAEIKSNLKDSGAVFVVKYSGLSSPDLTSLRQVLRDSNSNMLVVKNSVARRALKSAGLDGVIKSVDGPCGIVFSKSEAVDTSKVLFAFAKDHEKLLLEGGCLEARILDKKDIEALAKLPSKDVLRAQVLCAMKSPITGLVITLNQTLKKFVYCLDQVRQKKTV